MGRIVDLCGEIAAAAEEGEDGLVLPPEDWERLSQDFSEDEIEDALDLVRDSLSARLVELLGAFGDATAFDQAASGEARLSIEEISQLARRVNRLEEVLDTFRDTKPPDRRRLDALQRRLMDQGIEKEMASEAPAAPGDEDDSEED